MEDIRIWTGRWKRLVRLDLFVHLGDVEGGEYYINAVVPCEKHIVRGNNDFSQIFPREEEFYIQRKKCYHARK